MTSPWLADLVAQLWDSELHLLMCLFVGNAALSKNGYIVVKVVPGSFDSFDFFDFIAEQVVSSFYVSNILHNIIHILADTGNEALPARTKCSHY